MSEKTLIELKHVTKSYGDTLILDNVDLEIKQGTVTVLTGKSGIGKTTVLNIISKRDTDYFGQCKVELCGGQYCKTSMIPQQIELVDNWTVYENVMLPLLFDDYTIKKEIRFKVKHALENVGMQKFIKKRVNTLSAGQKQRIVIARSLVTSPQIILADEPTASLDEETAEEIFELLKKQCENNVTVVLVTHDMDLAMKCDYQYVIKEKKIMKMGETG